MLRPFVFDGFIEETYDYIVKGITPEYVEENRSEKDSKLYLNAQLKTVNGKTLIDGLGMINMPWINVNLKKELWREVSPCNRNFEDMDAEA